MILSGGRPGQYRVALRSVELAANPTDGDALTIDEALVEFLEDCRSRVSARTLRTYESVTELLRACLNSYGHQYLSESELDQFETAYQAGDEGAFCRLFGAEKIADSVGEFLGYFMIRKVAAGGDLLRASGTVIGKLMDWLAERGAVSPEVAHDAQRRARVAARDLPRAARLTSILLNAIDSGPPGRVETLGDEDYIEDELMISRVEPGSLWFDNDVGPVKVPKSASDLARPGLDDQPCARAHPKAVADPGGRQRLSVNSQTRTSLKQAHHPSRQERPSSGSKCARVGVEKQACGDDDELGTTQRALSVFCMSTWRTPWVEWRP